MRLAELAAMLAEGARFELAVHEVDAGFQDRWFQPLTHPSDKNFRYLQMTVSAFTLLCSNTCNNFRALSAGPKGVCNVVSL
jgi:hypothetical protein